MRRIPIEFPPVPGEALDSWLLAYAARLRTPLGDVAEGLGIGPLLLRQPAAVVALGRGIPDIVQIVDATGLQADVVEGLWRPLSRYDALVRRRFGRRRIARATRPMPWSRYCKPCLAESEGRWFAAWRLPWFVACPTHLSLLSSTCPSCGRRQRQAAPRHDLEPEPTRCSVARPGAVGRGEHRCGADLGGGAVLEEHPLALAAQNRLAVLLEPDADAGAQEAAADDLADLLTVASLTGLDFDSLDTEGLADTSAIASALDRAEGVLRDETGRSLAELATADMRTRPHPLPTPWRTAGPALTSRVLSIRDPRLRPVDRLRWRTTVIGARPEGHSDERFDRAVPEALWSDWSVRLRPRTGVEPASFRAIAAAALALPGSRRRVEDIVAVRGEDAAEFTHKLSHALQTVAGDDHGRCVLRALTQISDGLRAHGSPIDYARRRHIAATATPIDLKSWDGICAAAGVPTGGHRKLRHARLWVWELLTGGLPAQAPESVRPNHNSVLADYQRFALRLPHDAVSLLEDHARSVLDSHGCGSEPIAWSPPTEWVDLEGLPVPALDQLNVERLAVLLRTDRSPTDIAEELNTTLDHVRLVVRGTPDLFEPRNRTRAAGSPHRIIPPANLTTNRLRSLVVDERRTLTSLAAEFGVGRNYLADRLRREGIPVPPSRRPPVHLVDPQWLRVEYLVRRRTLPDIAAEVGTTAPTIARIARMHNIPLRCRGGRSHAASLSSPGDWPKLLAVATRGQGGTERVRRFQVYARLRSLNQAAAALGANQSVLTVQLAKLESACGGELLVRSTRRQERQRLTELGRRLLAQADEHLGAHPEAPSPLPQPLATAISSFWGSKRLHWFEVSARAESLARAATVLGCDRYALDRSIRGLEQAVGGVLLKRSTPVKPHTVTALGRKLLAQMETRFGASA